MNNKDTLIIKASYTSFDEYINNKIKEQNLCDLFEFSFENSNVVEKLKTIIKLSTLTHKYNNVIIFEEIGLAKIIRLNCKNKPNIFFWNTINDNISKSIEQLKEMFNLWTFDYNDSKKYSINLTQQFYFNIENKTNTIDNDMYFVGEDKNRFEQLKQIIDHSSKHNLKCNINMLSDSNTIYDEKYKDIYINEYIPYTTVLNSISKSKAIIDITKENQNGLTLRVLEAIFMNKKLITNNSNIKNEFFYDPNKIYIIEDDKYESLDRFINSGKIEYDKKTKEYYSFENWLNNFRNH